MNRILFWIIALTVLGCAPSTPGEVREFHTEQNPFFFIDSIEIKHYPVISKLYPLCQKWADVNSDIFYPISENWHYGIGTPSNGLKVTIDQKPKLDSNLNLPDRRLPANWSFWYEKKLWFEQDVYLHINGDDGVQCFLNGALQSPLAGNYFKIPASTDSLLITVRVLNNALYGGLRQVGWTPEEQFETFLLERKRSEQMHQLMYAAYRFPDAFDVQLMEKIKTALTLPDTSAIKTILNEFPGFQLPEFASGQVFGGKNDSFSFTTWGDSQGGWKVFSQLVEKMSNWPDPLSIGLGDLVSEGVDEKQWIHFTQCLQPLLDRKVIFPIVGNHDYDGYYNDLNPVLYKKYVLGNPNLPTYFSWVYGGAFFLALDPNESFPLAIQNKQRAWFFETINSKAWENANWRFILIHQPPYAQGWQDYHGDDFIRALVDSLAEEKQIDFVLSGHNHDYERLKKDYGKHKTHFFIFGGAGGGLEGPDDSTYPKMDTIIKAHHYARFEVNPMDIKVSVFGLENQLLDSMLISK